MQTPTDSLSKTEVELLYRAFSNEDYIAPPTDTVVTVGEEVFEQTIALAYKPDFATAVTRKPTSGKGLSFAVLHMVVKLNQLHQHQWFSGGL